MDLDSHYGKDISKSYHDATANCRCYKPSGHCAHSTKIPERVWNTEKYSCPHDELLNDPEMRAKGYGTTWSIN
jgi:hypothetical protein